MHAETFVHIELHGPADEVRGFVEGFRLAVGESRVYSAVRENVKIDGFFGSLLARAGHSVHYLVPEGLVGPLKEAIGATEVVEIELENSRAIRHAELEFNFRCFSAEEGEAIRNVIENDLPEGVVLEGYTVDKRIDADAKGTELYSPVHDFDMTGHGRFHGPVDGIIEIGRRLNDQDFIHPDRIRLVYSD